MNVTPKTHAQQVRKAAERKVAVTPDVRRLAFTSETGVVRKERVHEHTMETIMADLPGDRTVGYCSCGEYMDTGTWDERNE
jgi:hypothetical protein